MVLGEHGVIGGEATGAQDHGLGVELTVSPSAFSARIPHRSFVIGDELLARGEVEDLDVGLFDGGDEVLGEGLATGVLPVNLVQWAP